LGSFPTCHLYDSTNASKRATTNGRHEHSSLSLTSLDCRSDRTQRISFVTRSGKKSASSHSCTAGLYPPMTTGRPVHRTESCMLCCIS
jgi:hypothetical protein